LMQTFEESPTLEGRALVYKNPAAPAQTVGPETKLLEKDLWEYSRAHYKAKLVELFARSDKI